MSECQDPNCPDCQAGAKRLDDILAAEKACDGMDTPPPTIQATPPLVTAMVRHLVRNVATRRKFIVAQRVSGSTVENAAPLW